MSVMVSAADAYSVDLEKLTMETDIREDLSNESMKMIVMISTIEEELGVTIEIQEASLLNTLGDFNRKSTREIIDIFLKEKKYGFYIYKYNYRKG